MELGPRRPGGFPVRGQGLLNGRRGDGGPLYHTGLCPRLCSTDACPRLGPWPAAPPWVWLRPGGFSRVPSSGCGAGRNPRVPNVLYAHASHTLVNPFRYSLSTSLKPAGRTCSRFNPLPSRLEREDTVEPGGGTASRKKLVPLV